MTETKNNELRGFDPLSVQIEHIKPRMVLYGTDANGIAIRLKRFESLIEEELGEISIFPNAAEAASFLQTGSLFSDAVHVIVKDISDMLKTTKESKDLYKTFMAAVESYDDDSIIIAAFPYKFDATKVQKAFMESMKSMDALIRKVDLPSPSKNTQWLVNYACSLGVDLSPTTCEMVMRVCDGDVEKAANAVETIGSELLEITEVELSSWIFEMESPNFQELQKAIVNRDISTIISIKNKIANSASADRVLITKISYIVMDLMLASSSKSPNMKDYLAIKQKRVPRFTTSLAFNMKRQANESGGYERYSKLYVYLQETLHQMMGFGGNGSPVEFEDILVKIAE